MNIEVASEYTVHGRVVIAVENLLVLYVGNGERVSLELYVYPGTLKRSILLIGVPEYEDIRGTWDGKRKIEVYIGKTQQNIEIEVNSSGISKEYLESDGVQVRERITEQGRRFLWVYARGHKVFASRGGVDAYYHDRRNMVLYTYSEANRKVEEYLLFDIWPIGGNGIAFLFSSYLLGVRGNERSITPVQYAMGDLVSLNWGDGGIDGLFSSGEMIVYRNQYKRYRKGFIANRIWNSNSLIYVYSSGNQELLVLDKNLEILYEVYRCNVYIGDKYIFLYKESKTIVHYLESFKYAFYLTGLHLNSCILWAEENNNTLQVFEQKPVGRGDTPIFGLVLTEFCFLEKKKKVYYPIVSGDISYYGSKSYCFSEKMEGSSLITGGVFDISIIRKKEKKILYFLTGRYIFVFFERKIVSFPISSVEFPFLWKSSCALRGSAVRVDAVSSSLLVIQKGTEVENICFFPVLIKLFCMGHIPGSLLFSVYGESIEFSTALQKVLFFFFNGNSINKATLLISSIKNYSVSLYEECISLMVRLLDEKNLIKLCSVVDPLEIKRFSSSSALSRVILHDFSIFPQFLDRSMEQEKEYLIIEVINFLSKLEVPETHREVLSMLLQRKLFYSSGLLVSAAKTSFPQNNHFLKNLVDTFNEVHSTVDNILSSHDPSSSLDALLSQSKDSFFLELLSERFLSLHQEASK
ncbi:hypothetical protein NEFER03_0053 [Nematocida sp. LUAm3]|nr:hypothetical protein NEFER03_0053 [Nematocida sp. LUAm3]